jgi:hypothetical protein
MKIHKEGYPGSGNGIIVERFTVKGRLQRVISVDPDVNSEPPLSDSEILEFRAQIKSPTRKQNGKRHKTR